ncbi:hypothetical protein D3C81_1253400 [compost metagenome]
MTAIGSFKHHYNGTGYLTIIVIGHCTITGRITRTHLGNVADKNRKVILFTNNDNILDVGYSANKSFTTNIENCRSLFDVSTTGILVIGIECVKDIVYCDPISIKPVRLYCNLVLFEFPSETADFSNAFDTEQLPSDNPILDGTQLCHIIFAFVTLLGANYVLINFAKPRRNRP